MSGMVVRSVRPISKMPVVAGYRPLSIEMREGEHSACWT